MTGPIITPDVPTTRQFHFTAGRFSLSEVKIPYLQLSMSLDDASDSLRLVSEFPGVEDTEWRLEELFQREVDWNRVQNQIVPYLLGQTKAHFFNAITVALLPFTGNRIASFSDTQLKAPELRNTNQFAFQKKVGPLHLGYYQTWDQPDHEAAVVGQVAWNPRQTFAVAIDGQHRLAAIKELRSRNVDTDRLANTRVPVIAVMLAPELGYTPLGSDSSPIGVLRKLFIDLNKHAKPVHRGRQILLDDTDIHSLCVRSLIGSCVTHGKSELIGDQPRLPLSLVDWHSETAIFLSGPYLTTVLGLDWIVGAVLESRSTQDPTDYDGARKQLKSLSASLGLSMSDPDRETMLRLERSEAAAYPFYLLGEQKDEGSYDGELGRALNAFRRVWAGPITRILTELSPYKRLISARENTDTLSPEFVQWYALYQKKVQSGSNSKTLVEYNSLVERLRSRPEPITEEALEGALKELNEEKKDNLAFNVAFQRALFLAALEFSKLDGEGDEEDEEDIEVDESDDQAQASDSNEASPNAGDEEETSVKRRELQVGGQIDLFVRSLNLVFRKLQSVLELSCEFTLDDQSEYFWLGTLMKTDGSESIDFSLGGSKRASELVFWLAYLGALKLNDSDYDDFDKFYDSVLEPENGSKNVRRLHRSVARYTKEQGAAGKILQAADEEYDEELAWVQARERLRFVWDTLQI
jgi:DGQHR domain-containing protein